MSRYLRIERAGGPEAEGTRVVQIVETPYGSLDVDPGALELGELVVTDEGVELEVVGIEPLRFEPAPEEDEDWGE